MFRGCSAQRKKNAEFGRNKTINKKNTRKRLHWLAALRLHAANFHVCRVHYINDPIRTLIRLLKTEKKRKKILKLKVRLAWQPLFLTAKPMPDAKAKREQQ